MAGEDPFEGPQSRGRSGDVPPGFADRVMARIAAHEAGRRTGPGSRPLPPQSAARLVPAGLVLVAVMVFAVRLASVVLLFLNSPGLVE